MGPIEGDHDLTPLTLDDADDGLALVSEAGWNQTAADWRYMLSAGYGVGLRDSAGGVVATSIMLPYRPGIGWIGMVLVGEAHRRRGIATKLLRRAIEQCEAQRLTPMLDATPAGREVYERLGFAGDETIERWRGIGVGAVAPHQLVDVALGCRTDRAAFGADRSDLLAHLATRDDAPRFQLKSSILLGRRGRTATQLGPLLSADQSEALALCELAIDTIGGPLLIDVPARETALRTMLHTRGLTVERSFTRMSLGTRNLMGKAMRAIAGPELG